MKLSKSAFSLTMIIICFGCESKHEKNIKVALDQNNRIGISSWQVLRALQPVVPKKVKVWAKIAKYDKNINIEEQFKSNDYYCIDIRFPTMMDIKEQKFQNFNYGNEIPISAYALKTTSGGTILSVLQDGTWRPVTIDLQYYSSNYGSPLLITRFLQEGWNETEK